MKDIRLISLLLSLSVLLAFSACSRSAEPTSPSEEQQSAQVQENQPTSESETEDGSDDSLQQQTGQDAEEENLKLPSISDDSDSNCSKKEFGYFSLLLPKNYVIESNIIYEDNTELARKIAEIESVDMISDTESPFSTYDRIYSDAENISECRFGIYSGKRYSIQKEVSEGGMTGFQNTIVYCIKLENNIVSIIFYPQRGIGIDKQRNDFEKILSSISPFKKSDGDNVTSKEEQDSSQKMKRADVSCPIFYKETGIIEGETIELSLNVPADWIQSDTGRMFYLKDGILKAAEGFRATIIPEGQTIRSTAKVNLNMGYISSKTVKINGQEILLSIDFVPWDKNEKEPPEERKVYCYAYHIPYQDMYITIQFYAVRKDNEEAMQLHKEILESIRFVEDNQNNAAPQISE